MSRYYEEWKPITGYEGLYEVSNLGNVRNNLGQPIKQYTSCGGYKRVLLKKDGFTEYVYMHRLVAMHFISNPNNLPVVNHINEIKDDNRVENLEWCTQKYNCNHNDKGKRIAESGKEGSRNQHGCKTIYSIDEQGNKVYYVSAYDAERKTGIGKQCIYNCLKGLYRTAGKLRWFYSETHNVTCGLF